MVMPISAAAHAIRRSAHDGKLRRTRPMTFHGVRRALCRPVARNCGRRGLGMDALDITIVVLVVGARLFLPLLIPYVPVVGLLACLILDSADQTIFQQFPAIPLDGYQSYDKALDIYYLSIAYLSTMRNWTNRPAFGMSMFLYYYRLVGALLFELTQERWILFVFPNTFEYFFLFYELCRIRWDQTRMTTKVVIGATAFIWIVIKLPQEWWIHIAQLDFTDFMAENSWVLPAIIVFSAVVLVVGWWYITRKAPPADHRFRLRADPLPPELVGTPLYTYVKARSHVFDLALAQKAVLIGLVITIFAQFLSQSGAGPVRVTLSVAVFVTLNALLSQWLARRGRSWRSVAVEVVVMMVINLGMVVILETFERLVGFRSVRIPFEQMLFYVFLMTLLIIFFDRFHLVHLARGYLRRTQDRRDETPPQGLQDEGAEPAAT
jgi:hypothetical protein